ncbi:PqqD family protein [Mesorhizobium sp. M8A.F.Ca.ET.057.01.1.1]|uniref:PqqD family protein n=1 Tax=Mesorhizobium sp. M8A.F.Ca.ET.057.01.1.1 TaxID=2493679 RepID=UPI001FDEB8FE|nr:PqqD family protein [Mesorhizobium sp. M8A.F.Ca.ET.057.01.1.1]
MNQYEAIDRTVASGPADWNSATFVMLGRLVRVRGQNILFSPSRQAIFAVNDTAADIWRSLEEGMPPEAISVEMARGGVDRLEASRHVQAALADWQRLGLIRPCAPLSPSPAQELVSQVVAVAGLNIRIVYPAACAFPAISVFRHLEVKGDTADVLLEVVGQGGRVHLLRDGEWILSCSLDELAVILKGQLLTEVLDYGAYELALHAAALLRNERVVLLCGNPGAGKTTLTLALVHAGFGFVADDVTLLDSRGMALAFRLPRRSRREHGRCWPNTAPALMPFRSVAALTASVYDLPCPRRSCPCLPLPCPLAVWSCSVEVVTRKLAWTRSIQLTHCAAFSTARLRPAES